jgi:hypothetical protein
VRLTTQSALNLFNGLAALDGYDRVVKKGDDEIVVRGHFKFSGTFRRLLGRNMTNLRVEIDHYEKAHNALIEQLADGGNVVPPEKLADFAAQKNALLNEEVEVDLKQFSESELNLDENVAISHNVYSLIQPLLME